MLTWNQAGHRRSGQTPAASHALAASASQALLDHHTGTAKPGSPYQRGDQMASPSDSIATNMALAQPGKGRVWSKGAGVMKRLPEVMSTHSIWL